jgi:hypothetical protein
VVTDVRQGYFSLLRWRGNAIRDEERSVAVLLGDADGEFGAVRAAPLSAISAVLHEQGILDAAVEGLRARCDREGGFSLKVLDELHRGLANSLVVTEPKRVAVTDVDETANALYKAYLAARGGGGRPQTKGVLLDKVVTALRNSGATVRRGAYVDDFIFDAVVDPQRGAPQVVEVLSFAAPRKDWTPIEKDAGHFLFALRELSLSGSAVISAPNGTVGNGAAEAHERVTRWLDGAHVPILAPGDLGQLSFSTLS